MPYSISALLALPRSFAGLFFASKAIHISTPSPPVVKYTPTRTTHIFLEPTRCLPSPTSSDVQLPYVAMVGLASIILASVVFTVWSTFTLRRRRCSPTPSAAPPEPDPETKPDEFDPWPPWLMFISLNIAFHLSSTVTVIQAPPTKSLFPELMLYRLAMVLEESVLNVLGLIQHIHSQGRQYLNITLLTLVGHAIGLLIFFIHRRCTMPFLRHYRLAFNHIFTTACALSIPIIILLWHPNLNKSFSFFYYSSSRSQSLQGWLPDLRYICRDIRTFLQSLPVLPASMVVGPVAICSAITLLQTVFFFLCDVPSTIRTIRERAIHPRRLAVFIIIWTVAVVIFIQEAAVPLFMIVEGETLDDTALRRVFDLECEVMWTGCPIAQAEIWEIFRPALGRYAYWRSGHMKEFGRLGRFLSDTAIELPRSHQLLIVVPIFVFWVLCGFFYIKPVLKRVAMRIRYWHWRNQRERERYRAISKLG
ncbi:hypothetical protein FB45DRAFT_167295 [Roridomyces roridus]|uniref:Fungal pheromone STE3G-protein-coupled receptor n=1 Tax=Roridomyces roridus TaxID=1738132 RepID=A0AAD7BEA1_9AGAR|nr:hypothetical protein FB45DRAFT_167295 [Roridomyces roridus]